MQQEQSIFEYIKSHLVNGALPRDFHLSAEDEDQVRFADGAMDGIMLFHMETEDFGEDDLKILAETINTISAGDFEKAESKLKNLGEQYRVISIMDNIPEYIFENINELDLDNLFLFALTQIIESSDVESVKFCLQITGLITLEDDLKTIIRTLGLNNEFTIFVIFNMLNWENANSEIFNLVQNVYGWGRVHAIEYLDADTKEIINWLLHQGIKNDVLPEYSALTCMIKSDAVNRLKSKLNKKDFSAISQIIYYLLMEEPVAGISGLENPEQVLLDFLKQAEIQKLDLEDYQTVNEIKNYAETEFENDDLVIISQRLLDSEKCNEAVKEAVSKGEGIELARALDIPYKAALLKVLSSDFENNYYKCDYLVEDEKYLEDMLNIFRKNIHPASIITDPQDELGFDNKFPDNSKLDFLLQALTYKPLAGMDYLEKTISAITIRNRSLSMRVLKSWVNTLQKPLIEFAPNLYEKLSLSYTKEIDDDIKQSMSELLSGKTDFSEDEI